jgi:hypothetical protein
VEHKALLVEEHSYDGSPASVGNRMRIGLNMADEYEPTAIQVSSPNAQ